MTERTTYMAPGPVAPAAHPIPQASRVSGLSRSFLYRLMKDREIEAIKAGGRTLILDASLRAYLAARPRYAPKHAA
jgi:excisionase family DNA binding protein